MGNVAKSSITRNAETIHSSLAPVIHVTNEIHEPFQSDLDVRKKGLSPALARKVCREAGGRPLGKRVVVATADLCAYLRAHPMEPKPTKPVRPKASAGARALAVSTEEIARANGLRLVGGERGDR